MDKKHPPANMKMAQIQIQLLFMYVHLHLFTEGFFFIAPISLQYNASYKLTRQRYNVLYFLNVLKCQNKYTKNLMCLETENPFDID